MGYTTSTVHGIEVPNSAEANDVPEDIGKVVTALEGGSLVKRLTGAQIAALTAPQKPAGLVVYNTTTGRLQISDGTNFADVGAPAYAIGVRSSTINVTHASWWTVTHTAETDPLSILASGTVTLPSAGLWLVAATVTMNLTTQGDLAQMAIEQNGTAVCSDSVARGSADDYEGIMKQTTLIYAAASDTVRVRIQHTNYSSGSRDCLGARLAVAKIGA